MNYCDECDRKENNYKVYNRFNESCVSDCNFYQFMRIGNSCELCNTYNGTYYLDGKCVDNCTIKSGYGIYKENTEILYNNPQVMGDDFEKINEFVESFTLIKTLSLIDLLSKLTEL